MAPSPIKKRLIGYARVSTEDQAHDAQLDELRLLAVPRSTRSMDPGQAEFGRCCRGSSARSRPDEVLVVVRLDRLARSVSHLLEVIETLEARKAHFRSLRDPIDTSTPQGIFSLQVLGAVAQLERSLISERTRAGIMAAKARGKKPGNPGMRERRPEAIRKVALAREKAYLDELIVSADQWMPTVRRMRPHHPWEDVVRVLHDNGQAWTVARLRRAVGKLVSQHMADPALLRPAPRKSPEDRLMTLIAGIAMADPRLSLRDIGAQLERMRERTPRGGLTWSASSVKKQLDLAKKHGLALPSVTQGDR